MAKCPKCHRNTYSEKWKTCTACGEGFRLGPGTGRLLTLHAEPSPELKESFEEGLAVPGELCPICGQRIPKREKSTERVRKWRERKRK